MQLIVEKDYEAMSQRVTDIMIEAIKAKPNIVLGLATGSTTKGMYKRIIDRHKEGEIDFSNVISFNLDEYVDLEGTNPSSYRYYMNKHLFNHINIKKENIHIPNGKAEDLDSYTKEYDRLIEQMGGIDIQILGVGTNGHIAFNEPADELFVGTSVVNLTENTIKDNSRFFNTLDEVPKTAITMGMGGILKAKKVILLASGENKREIMARILESNTISTKLPASFLALHPDVTVILDEAAYNK